MVEGSLFLVSNHFLPVDHLSKWKFPILHRPIAMVSVFKATIMKRKMGTRLEVVGKHVDLKQI